VFECSTVRLVGGTTKSVRQFGGSTVRLFARSSEDGKRLGVGIERFEDLKSWQEARKLTQMVYRLTRAKAFNQDRGLGWQMEAAAASAMGHIARPVK
jgi:hypothetical protein